MTKCTVKFFLVATHTHNETNRHLSSERVLKGGGYSVVP